MKINLGCGNKTKNGYIGIDKYSSDAVDLYADINKGLPFRDSSIHAVYVDNLIEHIPDIPGLMQEIHRVSKHDASVTIITPHFTSDSSWRDPTHMHHLSVFSMEHFEKKSVSHYTGGGFKVVDRHLSFGGILGNIGRIIYKLSPRKYEKNWCFIFRASTITFRLKVVK